MSGAAAPWPAAIEGSPAATVLENAIARGRLAHALLLQGEDLGLLVAIAESLADRLLNTAASAARFPAAQHPDLFRVRPAGKAREIKVDQIRDEIIQKVQASPVVSQHKVAIIEEADRMNAATSNAFLKTLEEPPRDTTLLLLSTRPHSLLPTIRSRVQAFRFPADVAPFPDEEWKRWMSDYQALLGRCADQKPGKQQVSDSLLCVYGLIARQVALLERVTDASVKSALGEVPEDLDADEEEALEARTRVGVRTRFFGDMERATQAFARPRVVAGDAHARQALAATVEALEHSHRLLRLYPAEGVALESLLLAALRAWTRR